MDGVWPMMSGRRFLADGVRQILAKQTDDNIESFAQLESIESLQESDSLFDILREEAGQSSIQIENLN